MFHLGRQLGNTQDVIEGENIPFTREVHWHSHCYKEVVLNLVGLHPFGG